MYTTYTKLTNVINEELNCLKYPKLNMNHKELISYKTNIEYNGKMFDMSNVKPKFKKELKVEKVYIPKARQIKKLKSELF